MKPRVTYVAMGTKASTAVDIHGGHHLLGSIKRLLLDVTKLHPEWALISPMFYHAWLHLDPSIECNYETWVDVCEVMLKRSDLLLVFDVPGWEESAGVKAEIKLAEELGLEVVYLSSLMNLESFL